MNKSPTETRDGAFESEVCTTEQSDGRTLFCTRTVKSYPITESELSALAWWPWWMRRRLVNRIRAESVFTDEEPTA